MQDIALSELYLHPHNPRLSTRTDVVTQIAAQIKAQGGFDEAHALLVRPRAEGGYEIISGHHRVLAAHEAGLVAVPCWVREMSDEDAYMALRLTNTQSELHPLEEGLHVLRSGLSQREYARRIGVPRGTLKTKITAAELFAAVGSSEPTQFHNVWRALDAMHPAPPWLWPALVTQIRAETWTVEDTRRRIKPFANL